MAENSNIEWTDATWNPVTGCTLVDEGCRNCYAAHLIANWPAIGNHPSRKGLARKNAAGTAQFTGEVRFNDQWLDQPLRWKKPRRIFVCAHGDLFHPSVPDEWIDRVFAVMALCPQHTFQVLTKRPERMREYLSNADTRDRIDPLIDDVAFDLSDPHDRRQTDLRSIAPDLDETWPLPNIWLGTSISDQASADARIPDLLATPAAVRFVSAEPLLGPVDLTPHLYQKWMGADFGPAAGGGSRRWTIPRLDLVIVGGESGPKARPMHPDWARDLRDQCQAAGVAFFFKQWGEYRQPQTDDDHKAVRDGRAYGAGLMNNGTFGDPRGHAVVRVGKKAAGRLLDGRTWDQMPGGAA